MKTLGDRAPGRVYMYNSEIKEQLEILRGKIGILEKKHMNAHLLGNRYEIEYWGDLINDNRSMIESLKALCNKSDDG